MNTANNAKALGKLNTGNHSFPSGLHTKNARHFCQAFIDLYYANRNYSARSVKRLNPQTVSSLSTDFRYCSTVWFLSQMYS